MIGKGLWIKKKRGGVRGGFARSEQIKLAQGEWKGGGERKKKEGGGGSSLS